MSMSENTIIATNPGPIEGEFPIDLSQGPGAYEIRGKRGTGKTTLLSSIDWLAGHKVDVTLHDGAISGKIEGFGVVAPIGGRKRRKGDLTIDTIDAEKFSLTDLIDPPGKTPEVRDAHAIKALAVLSETQADAKLYYELAGGQSEFDALGVQSTDDPVLLATRIKQVYDKQARERQNTADAESGHALPLEHIPDGLDMSQSSDLTSLAMVRDKARDGRLRIKNERESGIAKEGEIVEAKSRLEKMRSEYSGPTVEEAEAAKVSAINNGSDAKENADKLKDEWIRADAAVEACRVVFLASVDTYTAARSHQSAVEEVDSLAAQSVEYPYPSAVTGANEAVEAATVAYDRGVLIRDVQLNQQKAKVHRDASIKAVHQATAARNKSGRVFDILAQSLNTKYLEIQNVDGFPRLFVQHNTRGKTAFDRVNGLSDGERVDFTLRELLPHIKSPGLLPIPQRVWQDLQPSDRKNLHELAVEKGLYLFGAQVDDGVLRIVFLGDDEGENNA